MNYISFAIFNIAFMHLIDILKYSLNGASTYMLKAVATLLKESEQLLRRTHK